MYNIPCEHSLVREDVFATNLICSRSVECMMSVYVVAWNTILWNF